jgi:hypothetical protein
MKEIKVKNVSNEVGRKQNRRGTKTEIKPEK